MGEPLLRLQGVGFRYRSARGSENRPGVHAVDLDVAPGEIHALVGLNGAGKSTVMKLLLGMVRAGSGTVEVLGHDVRTAPPSVWARVGAFTGAPRVYDELDVRTNLVTAARMHGLPGDVVDAAVGRALDELGLQRYAGVPARRLSSGNRQRLGLAVALVHDPALVVLDEPTNALDPAGIIDVRESLLRRAAAGTGVLVSSHHLDEVARIATRISILAEGHLVGSLDPHGPDLERAFFARVHEVATAGPARRAR